MSSIQEQQGWLKCSKCKLHLGRNKVVLGEGNLDARIMFIGEGPGSQEDKSGRPFFGPSGELLDKFLAVFDLNRGDVFVDNIVGCWPNIMDNGRRTSCKPPTDAVLGCKMRIQHSIYKVDPVVIVSLGGPALQALTGVGGITNAAGEVFETKVPGWYTDVAYPVYAMFHPAYILRQTPPDPNEKKPNEKHPLHKTYKHFADMLETIGLLSEAYYGVESL